MEGASQTSLEISRSLALRNFKKAASRYETFLSSNELDNEEHDVLFQDLFKSWNELIEKHEKLVLQKTDASEEDFAFIDENELLFHTLRSQSLQFKKKIKEEQVNLEQKKIQDELTEKQTQNIQNAKIQMTTLCSSYEMEMNRLQNIVLSFKDAALTSEKALRDIKRDFEHQREKVSHLFNLTAQHAETNDLELTIKASFIDLEQNFNVQFYKKVNVIQGNETKNPTTAKHPSFHLEKIKFPVFNGKTRDWPQFKKDFQSPVVPFITEDTTKCYTLRNALPEDAEVWVRNMDNFVEMWKRLDEKYGDEGKMVDIILADVKNFKQIKDNENKRLIQFIDVLEKVNLEMKFLGRESELQNTTIVNIIERKLPNDLKMKWIERIYEQNSRVDKLNKFPDLLAFLLERKLMLEYNEDKLESTSEPSRTAKIHLARKQEEVRGPETMQKATTFCLLHSTGVHKTEDCRLFLQKTVEDRSALVKEKKACFNCLLIGHTARNCRNKAACPKKECGKNHHKLLHDDFWEEGQSKVKLSVNCNLGRQSSSFSDSTFLQIMPVKLESKTAADTVLAIWDSASTVSLILNSTAKNLRLPGRHVSVVMETLGSVSKIQTKLYQVHVKDKCGNTIRFEAFGVPEISKDFYNLACNVRHFPEEFAEDEEVSGKLQLLFGLNVAQFHPVPVKSQGSLVLFENVFGFCVGGTLSDGHCDRFPKVNLSLTKVNLSDFFGTENMGVSCTPKCGNCKCGNCPLGAAEFSIKDQKEIEMIDKGLKLEDGVWTTTYPWIKDPKYLPINKPFAERLLVGTEKRLLKNPEHAKVYQEQMQDMLDRQVARKLDRNDLNYDGPVHYITHHEVLKEESTTTPCRIVFNASANYCGHSLNDYWAKGPDLLNNLMGILIKFREEEVGYIGDIRKMYHTVRITIPDQQTHRFL